RGGKRAGRGERGRWEGRMEVRRRLREREPGSPAEVVADERTVEPRPAEGERDDHECEERRERARGEVCNSPCHRAPAAGRERERGGRPEAKGGRQNAGEGGRPHPLEPLKRLRAELCDSREEELREREREDQRHRHVRK